MLFDSTRPVPKEVVDAINRALENQSQFIDLYNSLSHEQRMVLVAEANRRALLFVRLFKKRIGA